MFRLWGKTVKDNHILQDTVYENDDRILSRTKKIFDGLHHICLEFDLPEPLWLDKNITEFKRTDKTRFGQDNFIENIDFDFLELHVIEED